MTEARDYIFLVARSLSNVTCLLMGTHRGNYFVSTSLEFFLLELLTWMWEDLK